MISNLHLIYFSATGTTKKVADAICRHLPAAETHEYNLADAQGCTVPSPLPQDSLTVIAVPVHRGRVPQLIVEKLQGLRSDGSPAVIVCVYGNRDYDDALLEMLDIATDSGFNVIGGGAFIGEHSYSTDAYPIARNRPDEEDLAQCQHFAQELNAKILDNPDYAHLCRIIVPGNAPYKAHPVVAPLSPETIAENCTLCGTCAEVCPSNAVTVDTIVTTDKDLCIWCCACVKSCPEQSRVFYDNRIEGFSKKLSVSCSERKEPEWFM